MPPDGPSLGTHTPAGARRAFSPISQPRPLAIEHADHCLRSRQERTDPDSSCKSNAVLHLEAACEDDWFDEVAQGTGDVARCGVGADLGEPLDDQGLAVVELVPLNGAAASVNGAAARVNGAAASGDAEGESWFRWRCSATGGGEDLVEVAADECLPGHGVVPFALIRHVGADLPPGAPSTSRGGGPAT